MNITTISPVSDHATYRLFRPADAEALAAHLAADPDEDWWYIARHNHAGGGYSVIDIYDENGEYIGRL